MGDILQFGTVQWAPAGFRSGPALLVYTTNGGQDPENFVNDIPASFENTSLDLGIRAYDRALAVHNEVDGIVWNVYQQNDVWELYDGVNWRSAINLPDQYTAADYAYHTGLYHVSNGSGEWAVGLYRLSGGGLGWLKCDLSTKTWSRGSFSGATNGSFGKCVVHRGKLYHATQSSILQEFNPETNHLQEYYYGSLASGGTYANLASINNRLFLFPDTGNPQVLELAFGGIVPLGTIDSGNTIDANYSGGGGNTVVVGIPGLNDIGYFWCTGVAGFRFHYVTVTPGSAPGDAVTITNNDTPVPDGSPNSQDSYGFSLNMRYPGAASGVRNWLFTDGGWNLEASPLYGPSPAAYVMLKVNTGSFLTFLDQTIEPFSGTSRRVDWRGTSLVMQFVNVVGNHTVSVTYSQCTSVMGDSTRLVLLGPGVSHLEAEPYSDGVVSRGLLITFKVPGQGLSGSGSNNVYLGIGRYQNKPAARATLSVAGNGNDWVGGAAVFNPTQNRIDNVPTKAANAVTLYHDSAVGTFSAGEIIEGQTSLARGLLGVNKSSAMFVYSGTGFPFVSGEQIKGLSSLATANLTAPPDGDPTYQVVWDLDADSVGDYEWVTLQAAQFAAGVEVPGFIVVSPTYYTGETYEDTSDDTPDTTTNDGAQVYPTSSATPFTIESDAESLPTSSATPFTIESNTQEGTSTNQTPLTTTSLAEREIPEGDYFGEIYGRVSGRAHTEPSGIELLVDGTPQGGIRPNLNITNLSNPRFQGSQGVVVDQGDRYKAQLAVSLSGYGFSEPGRLARVSGVDATVVAATDLLPVPSGYEAIVTGASARVTAGSPTVPAIAGVGTNGTQDNILLSQFMTGLLSAPDAYEFVSGGLASIATAGQTVRLGIDAPANAAQTLEITLFGYLRAL